MEKIGAPYYIGDLDRYTTIKAENAEKYLWSEFLKYRDISFIKRFWPGQNEEDYRFISSSSYQAYEYFEASKSASIYTRPMLLYYSILNLTKSVLFFCSESKPKDYHGICKFNFTTDFMLSEGESNNGIFTELSKYLGVTIPNGRKYTLRYFVKNITELSNDYNNEFDDKSMLIPINLNATMGGFMSASISKATGVTKDIIVANSNILDDFDIVSDDASICLKSKREFSYPEIETIGKDMLKQHLVFSIYPNNYDFINLNEPKKQQLPQLVNYFGMLAILSNLVRYKPERVYEITNGAPDTHIWFLNRMCDVAERAFPNLLYSMSCNRVIKFSNYS